MASENKIEDNSLPEEIYNGKNSFLSKTIFLSTVLLILGILLNFPLEKTVKDLLLSKLLLNKSCPISFEKLKAGLFLPKITISNMTMNGKCFSNPQGKLNFNKVSLKFNLPTLFPPAIKAHAHLVSGKTSIHIYPLLGFGNTKIRIKNSKITSETLEALTANKITIAGAFDLNALLSLSFHKSGPRVKSGDIKLYSKNFVIPTQNIASFNTPNLDLNNLELSMTLSKSEIEVKKLIIGNPAAPIHGQFKGDITLSKKDPLNSSLNLIGEAKFTKAFLSEIPILSPMWNLDNQTKTKGYYKMKLSGPIKTFKSPIFLK